MGEKANKPTEKRRRGNPNWTAGVSGNPSGRPKKVQELVEIARLSCPRALERAAELLEDGDGRVSMAAAAFLRDTGMGRPSSQAEFDLAKVSDEDLEKEILRRVAVRRAAGIPDDKPAPTPGLDS